MVKTKKRNNRKNITIRNIHHHHNHKNNHQKFEQEIVIVFLETLNLIKLHHWKTYSYATHKATDEFYSKISDNIDTFTEVLLGKNGHRINLSHIQNICLKDVNSINEFKNEINIFKNYLIKLNDCKAMKSINNSDLYNIRDDMISNINQFLYLLSMNK